MKTTLRKMVCTLVVASMLVSGGAITALAAEIVSDYLRVYNQYHTTVYGVTATTIQQEINGAAYIYVLDVPGIADPAQWGNYTSVIQAPGDQVMSDAFGVLVRGSDEYLLFFLSDTSTQPCPYPLAPNFIEYEYLLPNGRYGGIFDATRYLHPDLRAQGWTAEFGSGAGVPEPATFFLLGGGIGVLLLLKKRTLTT